MIAAPFRINVGRWLRWCYENLGERGYLLMLHAHRADQAFTKAISDSRIKSDFVLHPPGPSRPLSQAELQTWARETAEFAEAWGAKDLLRAALDSKRGIS